MTVQQSFEISPQSPGVVSSRRSPLLTIARLIRNPLEAIPPEVFVHPLVYAEFGNAPRLYISDPHLIHEALVKNSASLSKGEDVRRALGPALGDGLLTADGAHWKWQRQAVASAFQWEKLKSFLPTMIDAAERRRDLWALSHDSALDIGHEMMQTTFDIIVETMMSGRNNIDVEAVERSVSDYLEPSSWVVALGLLKAPEWVPYPGKSRAGAAVTYLRQAMRTMLEKRRANPDSRDDLVAMLLNARDPESGQSMDDDQIIDNLMTFMTAGHETTALGLAWTFHLLSRHPEIEQQVCREIHEVVGKGSVQPEHIDQLTYTKQVFNEAMRLYPPAPIIVRTVEKPFRLGEHLLPKGLVLLIPIYAIHRHQALWDEPLRFDPSRFSEEEAKGRHRYAFMPFGAGPRVCIGSAFATMEAVTILAVLLQRFRLQSVGDEKVEPLMRITLRPKKRLFMRFSERPPFCAIS
ncbi:cytochrome P450 [Rhizobium paknamense]|uniref:Cytochrome P450 n=1 Tax=Rhizobium paknamense TaxID=1206817 RepID=A0ABU0I6H2_9HYPH|nr:cytochrome P450 [Rhizobium paknamense]